MDSRLFKGWGRVSVLLATLAVVEAWAASDDLGNGFLDHGIASPMSNHRGIVATVDGQGRNVVLVWLFDHRGGYALLLIDAETGQAEQFPMPFPPGGDCPYASILSSRNKFYTHFNGYFVEFDPAKRAFTFHHPTAPQMAMGMTEDDNGVIWAVTYPQSGVVSFDPQTRELKDYGHVHKENWKQYQRHVAADDTGWVYFGIGSTASHIIGFDPNTGTAKPMIPETDRKLGSAGHVIRDVNGKVYGWPGVGEDNWYELHKGQARKVGKRPAIQPKPIITGSQSLFQRDFPDGKRIQTCNTVERILEIKDPKAGNVKRLTFEYTSEGAIIMSVAAAPNATICGGTTFPMRFFSYDPKRDQWINRAAYGQWNTVVRQGKRFFVGGYPGGFFLEWDPAHDWVATKKDDPDSNPLFLAECNPDIYRPHGLLALPDGNTTVMSGTPAYGHTGGGLLFWDRQTGQHMLLKHTDILPQHSTTSLAALPNGKLLGGSTTNPGTGGERLAEQAELYIMDMATRKIEWHAPVLPGVQDYSDLFVTSAGRVFGVADRQRFFVFNPIQRKIVHEQNTVTDFGLTNFQQGPRIFVRGAGDVIYMLFEKGIARVEPLTFKITMLAESPVHIDAGGDFFAGRIYFASGSHLYSFKVPEN